jgi:hypothetical protein
VTRRGSTACEWCGRKFTVPNDRGPIPLYCSAAHRQAAYASRQSEPHVLARKLRRLGWTVTPPEE